MGGEGRRGEVGGGGWGLGVAAGVGLEDLRGLQEEGALFPLGLPPHQLPGEGPLDQDHPPFGAGQAVPPGHQFLHAKGQHASTLAPLAL